MTEQDDFKTLVRAAADLDEKLSDVTRSAGVCPGAGSSDFERRVMIEVARRAIERSRRKARRGVAAALAGLAMLLAGCVAALVVWFPTLLPTAGRMQWLDNLHIMLPTEDVAAAVPLFEQWGGVALIVLALCGAGGFIYYLNSLFSSDITLD